MVISSYIYLNNDAQVRNNTAMGVSVGNGTPERFYESIQDAYPKFFKMDKLCKWAINGVAYLFANSDQLYAGKDKNNIAVVLSTSHGCIDVDKRYQDGIAVPSPSLFVYTLPNIMLGEICIRYGFKGEQLCMVQEGFDAQELYFTVQDLFINKGMAACLCGWVDAAGDQYDVCLFWIAKTGTGAACTPAALQAIYQQHKK